MYSRTHVIIPQPNMTFISMCDDVVIKFKGGAKDCLDKSVGGKKILNVFLVINILSKYRFYLIIYRLSR